jgi:hypothetical protein
VEANPPAPSPARAIAQYLSAVRGQMNEASESRKLWVRQIGTVMQDARTKPSEMVAPTAGEIGSTQRALFQQVRDRVVELSPPTECLTCHDVVLNWLDKQLAACDVMVEVGQTGDVSKLRATQGLLAEGRLDTQRFNAEYTSLVSALKARVQRTATRRPAARKGLWPFGGAPERRAR